MTATKWTDRHRSDLAERGPCLSSASLCLRHCCDWSGQCDVFLNRRWSDGLNPDLNHDLKHDLKHDRGFDMATGDVWPLPWIQFARHSTGMGVNGRQRK